MLQVTDDLIRSVVKDVLSHMKGGLPAAANGKAANGKAVSGRWGVFEDVNEAVIAATAAHKRLQAMGIEARRKAVECVRRIVIDRAEELGRQEVEEPKIGPPDHQLRE